MSYLRTSSKTSPWLPGGRGVTTLPSSKHLRRFADAQNEYGSIQLQYQEESAVRQRPKGDVATAVARRTLLYLVNRVRKCQKKTLFNLTRRQ
ncbi:MAG: hypothetical protein [Circoviridae sp.]|nr:MAG: hypothetical protein [Circoviridae sp.]